MAFSQHHAQQINTALGVHVNGQKGLVVIMSAKKQIGWVPRRSRRVEATRARTEQDPDNIDRWTKGMGEYHGLSVSGHVQGDVLAASGLVRTTRSKQAPPRGKM